jgi:hypothetical protein
MADLKSIIAYILLHYPFKDELSNARVTKMVYLADWKHALTTGQQLSSINWYFDNFGPFVWDVKTTASDHPELFAIEQTSNMFGESKSLFVLKSIPDVSSLSKSGTDAIQHVIESTSSLGWVKFIRLVYGTYPITNNPRYSYLNLEQSAKEYKMKQTH